MLSFEEVGAFDKLEFTVSLNRFEVVPILRDNCRIPSPRAHSNQYIKRHSLRGSGLLARSASTGTATAHLR